MTDIDLTAAIRPTSDAIYRQLSGQYGDFSTPSDEEAEAVLKAALPHILAQVEARVKPDREAVARAIHGVIVASAQTGRIDIEVHDSVPSIEFERTIADSVLALLPGKTEQEVREEVAREHEEKMDRLFEGEWQAGYVAGNNDQLNGTICGRRRAANEGIARGGEQND